jgi:membrane-associated protein
MTSLKALLLSLLSAMPIYKYALLFLLVIVEGPLITMGAGFLGFLGYLNLPLTYVIICVADLVGDCVYYSIGAFGTKKFANSKNIGFHISPSKLQKMKTLLHKHSGKTLLIAKLTHLGGVPILVASGLAKINFFDFLKYNAIATFPKSLFFLSIGYYFGKSSSTINRYLEYGTFLISGVIILITIFYLTMRKPLEEKLFDEKK